jgi:uncharacterized protein YebE (UPF0316 family)
MDLFDGDLWQLGAIPVLIFCARLGDVTLGTVRIILVSRGMRLLAPVVGFFEVLVWLFALSTVMQHLDRPLNFVAWAAGFATGTYVGILVEDRIALGLLSVRVITEDDASDLVERLRVARFGVTDFAARGLQGRVRFLLTVIPRRDLERVMAIVREVHPRAFVSVSDVRSVSEGYIVRQPRTGFGRALAALRK